MDAENYPEEEKKETKVCLLMEINRISKIQ
jgi:hypothetical protein